MRDVGGDLPNFCICGGLLLLNNSSELYSFRNEYSKTS